MGDEVGEFEMPAPRASKKLQAWGFVATVVWLAVLGLYAVFNPDRFANLSPNEVGDFLAGAFAPLAFLWLVLGFFQQGEELRHSGRALWLQGRELQASVEQQRELVKVTRDQLSLEREMIDAQRSDTSRAASPVFDLRVERSDNPAENPDINVRLTNYGKRCTDVRLYSDEIESFGRDPLWAWNSIETSDYCQVWLTLKEDYSGSFELTVTYLNERSSRGSITFAAIEQVGRAEFGIIRGLTEHDLDLD